MEIFTGQNLLEFAERFKTDLDCEQYLAHYKWKNGFICRKCGHKKCQIRKDFSRTCNICSDTESPSAGTLFHRVKFGLRRAFFICFEIEDSTKSNECDHQRFVRFADVCPLRNFRKFGSFVYAKSS